MRLLKYALIAFVLLACVAPRHEAVAQNILNATPCNKKAIYDNNTNGSTQMIAAGNPIYVCGYVLFSGGTVNVKFVSGTGTNCGNSTTSETPAYQFVAQTGIADNSPFFRGFYVTGNRALCINTSGGVAVQATIYFSQ